MVKSVCIYRLCAKAASNVPASVREMGHGLFPAAPGSSAGQEGPRLPATQHKRFAANDQAGRKPAIMTGNAGPI